MNTRGWVAAGAALVTFLTVLSGRGDTPEETTSPFVQINDSLPVGAVRRLGDLRFYADNSQRADFSPDGSRLATFGSRGVCLLDTRTGQRLTQLDIQDSAIGGRFISPSKVIVCWSSFGRKSHVDVCDFDAGKIESSLDMSKVLPARPNPQNYPPLLPTAANINEFAANSDGSRIAVVSDTLLLCDGKTGAVIRDFGFMSRDGDMYHRAGHRVQFSSDDQRLLAVDFDGLVHVADARTGKDIVKPIGYVLEATLSADGKTIAAVGDDLDLHMFDVETRAELDLPDAATAALQPTQIARQTQAVQWLTFSPAGSTLAVARLDGTPFTLIDAGARPCGQPRRIGVDNAPVFGAVWSHDGKTIAACDATGRWEMMDAATGSRTGPKSSCIANGNRLLVSPDGRDLLVGTNSGTLIRENLETGEILASRTPFTVTDFSLSAYAGLNYSDDGASILVTADADVRWIDGKTLKTTRRVTRSVPVGFLGGQRYCQSEDGKFSASNTYGDLFITELATRERTVIVKKQGQFNQVTETPVSFSPDDQSLVAGTSSGMHLLDLKAKSRGPLLGAENPYGAIGTAGVFTRDGKWLMTFSPDRVVRVFDTASASVPVIPQPPVADANPAPAVGRRPAAQYDLAQARPYASDPRQLPVWETPRGVSNAVATPVFTPAGALLAVASNDFTARTQGITIFETATGKPLAHWLTPPDCLAIAAVPNQPQWVSLDRSNTMLVWDLRKVLKNAASPPGEGPSVDSLWQQVQSDDPAVAYTAGLALIDAGQLANLSAKLNGPAIATATTAPTAAPVSPEKFADLIARLSSPDSATKEEAHKSLESAGADALPAVRRAIATHPGGETEDRLVAIERVISAASELAPEPPVATPSAPVRPGVNAGPPPRPSPVPDHGQVVIHRVIQLLKWSPEPNAKAAIDRLEKL